MKKKNWIVLGVVAFIFIFPVITAKADPPAKPGNQGLPGCLANLNELQKLVDKQKIVISNLQDQIIKLQATVDSFKNYAPVAQTGQKYPGYDRDDAALQKGVVWPVPRFTDNNDGTVTDNLTKLVWLKDASCFESNNWYQALIDSNNLLTGFCGLTDGSSIGDWRLPNRNELLSLVDINYDEPYDPNTHWHGALPDGHPFNIRPSTNYWTSSTSSYNFAATAWVIFMSSDGSLSQDQKASTYNGVWPVRDFR